MNDSNQIDNALCKLNAELIDIQYSKEYLWGRKLTKLIYALRHFQFNTIRHAVNHIIVAKRCQALCAQNENFITHDDYTRTDSRIAVYTCITGDNDKLIEPVYVPYNIDFYVVTDLDIDINSAWKKIDINEINDIKNLDNTKKARFIKTHPHLFFSDYEYSIWIDANIKVVGDLSKYIGCVGKVIPFASNWHPERNCIYNEFKACVLLKKDNPELMRQQIDCYRLQGFPCNFGLIETGLIVRKHSDKRCIALMEAWWSEIACWSKRDQLSLPYVIWKLGYTMNDVGFICTDIRKNPRVQLLPHSSSAVANKLGKKMLTKSQL